MTLAEAASAFSQLWQDANFYDLPAPLSADIRRDGAVGVRMHLAGVRETVTWAVRFGTPVEFSRHTSFVQVSTKIEVAEVQMQLWAQLTHDEAFELLHGWGYKLEDLVSIPAAHAYALSTVSA